MTFFRTSRRGLLLGAAALGACGQSTTATTAAGPDPKIAALEAKFAEIETRVGGRIGVSAVNTADGARAAHRGDERFAMCSTFKWLLAAQVLQRQDNDAGYIFERLRYTRAQLLPNSPAATANAARGWMTVEELCQAMVVESDNTAANVLLAQFEGPEGFTRFIRGNADANTRLDRIETDMAENLPGDPRDTTTPNSMSKLMQQFLVNSMVLQTQSRDQLIGWMVACKTGKERLRAGFPATWRAGDKTGTNGSDEHNATNDVAIAWPKDAAGAEKAPIIVSCYMTESTVDGPARNAAHAEVARAVAEAWG